MTLPPHQGTGVAAGRSALRRTGEKGLLQTEAYMRAVMLAWTTVPSDEEIERMIAVRLKRQERLQGEDAPKVWIVLNEAALRRETGGRATMREQLQRLTDVTRLNRWCCRCLRSLPGHILRSREGTRPRRVTRHDRAAGRRDVVIKARKGRRAHDGPVRRRVAQEQLQYRSG